MQSISLWGHALKLQVGGISIDQSAGTNRGLRVIFSVERDDKQHPNNAQIQVFNLAPDSRAKLEEQSEMTCSLEAGYEDGISQIFFGVVRSAVSDHDGTEWITSIGSGDGEKAFKEAHIYKTFALGTPVAKVVQAFADALGIGTGNSAFAALATIQSSKSPVLKTPLTVAGRVSDEFTDFMSSLGAAWSIQNGELTVQGDFVPPTVGPLISKETGLVEKVSIDEKGLITFKALLMPSLVPGALFVLKSEKASGTYRAKKTHHYGDTYESDWFVECQAEAI